MLPQELIEIIIQALETEEDHAQRKAALAASALTSWAFLSPARKHLFAEVRLVEDGGYPTRQSQQQKMKLEKFLRLLDQDPCHSYPGQPLLASHIRSLNIELSKTRAVRNSEQEHEVRPSIRSNEKPCSTLATILPVLRNVEKLNLSLTASQSWQFLDNEVQYALLQFSSSSSVTSLRIHSISCVPGTMVSSFPNLRSLSLEDVTISDWTSSSETSSLRLSSPEGSKPTVPVLESLFLGRMKDDFIQICLGRDASHLQLSKLQTLTICPESREVWELIQQLPFLHHLVIASMCGEEHARFLTALADFGLLKGLQTLEIKGSFGHLTGLPPMTQMRIFREQDPTVAPTFIHTLTLSLEWVLTRYSTRYSPNSEQDPEHLRPSSGWRKIDSVLASPRFPNLSFVQFNLLFDYQWDTETAVTTLAELYLEHVEERIEDLLPSVSKATSIQVAFTIDVAAQRLS